MQRSVLSLDVRRGLRLGFTIAPAGVETRNVKDTVWEPTLLYVYRYKLYTSDLAGDTHFNRLDHTHQGIAEFSYAMNQAASVTLGYQRSQRDSTNQNREFHADLYSIGVRYTF